MTFVGGQNEEKVMMIISKQQFTALNETVTLWRTRAVGGKRRVEERKV